MFLRNTLCAAVTIMSAESVAYASEADRAHQRQVMDQMHREQAARNAASMAEDARRRAAWEAERRADWQRTQAKWAAERAAAAASPYNRR